ncbi:unnamed protein product [Didymodactylos carnosus]|uniref:mitogen-activated protein kinase kinase n=1 Tax=Didymodactylos carnosus TaxID=1234261 RepID=A0A8S2ULD5_9BILA|nr:unnamed protein product [Didymodactylos carnosus]
MKLCSQSLQELTPSINELPDETFKYLIRSSLLVEVIECLNHLYSLKHPVIHRDLKPHNVLIIDGSNGRFTKLCDFGLSKFLEESQNTRGQGLFDYMAPEVINYDINANPG